MRKHKHSIYNLNLKGEGYEVDSETLVYNVLTGKFAEIPINVDLNNPPSKLLEDRFIIPTEVNEVENYINNQNKLFNDDYPESIALLVTVTMSCNYHCAYCFQGEHTANANMSEDVVKDTIDYIKNEIDRNSNLKRLAITYFGGEPLMNMAAIRQISGFCRDYAKEKGITYAGFIDTNGFFMTKEISRELKDVGISKAQIAIDGFENFYNTTRKAPKEAYQKVLNNIEQSEIPIVIRINVTKKNQEEVKELLKYLYNLDSVKSKKNSISVYRVMLYSNDPNYDFTDAEWLKFRECMTDYADLTDPSRLFVLPKSYCVGCGMQRKHSVVIGTEGELYRCDRHTGDKTKVIGSIYEGIAEDNPIEKQFRTSIIDAECRECKYLPICTGDGLCRLTYINKGKTCDLTKGLFKQRLQNYLKYVGVNAEKKPKKGGSLLALKK